MNPNAPSSSVFVICMCRNDIHRGRQEGELEYKKKKKKVGRVMTRPSRSSVFRGRRSEGGDKWKKGSCRPLSDGVTGREVERGMS